MEQNGHTDPNVTLGIYTRAIRNRRRSVRPQPRLAALSTGTARAHELGSSGSKPCAASRAE